MAVVRGTTPGFFLTFPTDINFDTAANVYVTFKRNDVVITKSDDLVRNGNVIYVSLTQEESMRLGVGEVEIQANWITSSGIRTASNIVTCEFTRQLLTEVIQ